MQKKTFILNYSNKGCLLEVKHKILKMAINGSGIRDTVKVLGVGINTVIKQIKKTSKHLHAINLKYLYEK